MSIIHMVKYTCRDTIAVLRVLLEMALKGQLRGLAICYRDDSGQEETIFTGVYKAHPDSRWGAIGRMSWEMTQASDAKRGPP